MKVLIVEDRPKNRKAAKEVFAEDDITFAETLEEAKKHLQKTTFDCAVLDGEFPRTAGQKPEKLGVELGQQIKEQMPCCLVSAFQHDPASDTGTVVQGKTAFWTDVERERIEAAEQARMGFIDTRHLQEPKSNQLPWKLARQYLVLRGLHPIQSNKVKFVLV